ncbi:unnamed protein product [Mytilus coruscus]|uniref:Uncharacterized protein n=1 Tax=Mytilus coruscus TaxID=42192 RepID=A0A6J8BZ32_MYTCO|nr:unnamed protein product [Mytilus coruscus]
MSNFSSKGSRKGTKQCQTTKGREIEPNNVKLSSFKRERDSKQLAKGEKKNQTKNVKLLFLQGKVSFQTKQGKVSKQQGEKNQTMSNFSFLQGKVSKQQRGEETNNVKLLSSRKGKVKERNRTNNVKLLLQGKYKQGREIEPKMSNFSSFKERGETTKERNRTKQCQTSLPFKRKGKVSKQQRERNRTKQCQNFFFLQRERKVKLSQGKVKQLRREIEPNNVKLLLPSKEKEVNNKGEKGNKTRERWRNNKGREIENNVKLLFLQGKVSKQQRERRNNVKLLLQGKYKQQRERNRTKQCQTSLPSRKGKVSKQQGREIGTKQCQTSLFLQGRERKEPNNVKLLFLQGKVSKQQRREIEPNNVKLLFPKGKVNKRRERTKQCQTSSFKERRGERNRTKQCQTSLSSRKGKVSKTKERNRTKQCQTSLPSRKEKQQTREKNQIMSNFSFFKERGREIEPNNVKPLPSRKGSKTTRREENQTMSNFFLSRKGEKRTKCQTSSSFKESKQQGREKNQTMSNFFPSRKGENQTTNFLSFKEIEPKGENNVKLLFPSKGKAVSKQQRREKGKQCQTSLPSRKGE